MATAKPAKKSAWGDQEEIDAALANKSFTKFHFMAVLVAGVGFFADAYDLFIIGLAKPAIGMAYYNSPALPRNADLIISAAALVGTLCGQLFWGVMGDRFGRKSTFMITLLILIVATIGQVTSASAVRGASFLVWLVFWRLIVGFGLGGEYPLCATIASEFSNRHNRGALVSAVFAMQGFGILMASLVALAVTAAFRSAVEADVLKLDLVWRIMLGLGIVPSVVTLGLRESMPESPEFEKDARALAASATADAAAVPGEAVGSIPAAAIAAGTKPVASTLRGYLTEPSIMKNRNAWVLLGTSMTWLLLDVAFYSQNLFLPDVLRATGFSKFPKIPAGGSAACVGECAKEVWEGVFRSAAGNALVAIVGTVPGYWVTVFTIEKLGRVRIQVMGFTMMTLMLVILAGLYNKLVPPPGTVGAISPWVFLILYSMTFFFANFGPNTTTFVVPAEVFHTRYRATLHGVSAASGKLGAVIGAFGFGALQLSAGTRPTLVALAVVNFFGLLFTFFIPETTSMELGDASTKSLSAFGRHVQKQPECPIGGVTNADSHSGACLPGKGGRAD